MVSRILVSAVIGAVAGLIGWGVTKNRTLAIVISVGLMFLARVALSEPHDGTDIPINENAPAVQECIQAAYNTARAKGDDTSTVPRQFMVDYCICAEKAMIAYVNSHGRRPILGGAPEMKRSEVEAATPTFTSGCLAEAKSRMVAFASESPTPLLATSHVTERKERKRARKRAQIEAEQADSPVDGASRVLPVADVPSPPSTRTKGLLQKGESYQQAMDDLGGIPVQEKHPYGDYLDVTYKDPRVLAYPDANGVCKVSFAKGKLTSCEGCDPGRFACE